MAKVFNEVWLSYSSCHSSKFLYYAIISYFYAECLIYSFFILLNLLQNHKDQDDHYEDDLLSIADPLNQVCALESVLFLLNVFH